MNFSASTSKSGFSLVEVMVAGTLMAAGVVGLIQVISSGSQMIDTSRKQTVALQLIHSEIEKLRTMDWTQISLIPTGVNSASTATIKAGSANKQLQYTSGPSSLKTIDSAVALDSTFECRRTVTDVSGRTNFKLVTYAVTWTSISGKEFTRTGSTYVSKDGLNVSYRR